MKDSTLSRPLALMGALLVLYAITHVVLFAISGEPVYLFIAGPGAVVAGLAAWLRGKES